MYAHNFSENVSHMKCNAKCKKRVFFIPTEFMLLTPSEQYTDDTVRVEQKGSGLCGDQRMIR